MAGYKKQSPLKKYGRRDVRKLDVSEQKRTYDSNAKAQGSVGRAVGAVGTAVGDAVDTALEGKKKRAAAKKKADAAAKAKQKAKLQKGADDANAKLQSTIDTGPIGPKPTYPTISEIPPKKIKQESDPTPPAPVTGEVFQFGPEQNTQPRGAWQGPLVHPTGDVYSTQQDPNQNVAAWGRGVQAHKDAQRTQMYEGPGGFSNMSGRNPINRIQPGYTKSPFRRNPYGNSPFKRMSPLKAKADELSAGSQHVEQRQKLPTLSYLGEEGAAAAEGYNAAVERHNYKQRVWAEKAKDVDDAYGKLSVEPTGISSWDASAQVMAKEWKDEFTDLYNNKDQYSYEEYANRLSDIKSRASNYQNANANIQKIVQDYDANKDNVSASTPPDNIDILETLAKGGDGLTTENVNGVPTLVGTTLGGQEVSVPISDIASGKNLWKVNQTFDATNDLIKITDSLGKFKTQIAQNSGLTTQSIGWDKLAERASSQIDGILSNPQRTQAIAAEKYGIDYDEWQELGDEAATARVKQGLMTELQNQFQPYEQVQSFSADPRVATQQRQQQLDQAQQRIDNSQNKPSTGERDTAKINTYVNKLNKVDAESISNLTGAETQLSEDGKYVLIINPKNGKRIQVPTDNLENARQIIAAQIYGATPTASDNKPPLNRKSPFRRLMNFITGS